MPDQAPLEPNDGYFVAQTLYLSSTGPALPAPRVSAQTEDQVRRIVNSAVLEAADNFMGMCGNPFDQGDLFNDLYGAWYANPYFMPPYYWQSQKRGEVIPVYLNELQLRYIRDRQRKLCSENPYAQCAIAASQNYCVGEEGFVFQAVPASHHETNGSHIRQVQRIIDVWAEENDMPTYERDMVEMGIVNGDIITRHFPQKDGIVWIRTVQAEHLRSPTGESYDAQHSFGIQTAAGDIEDTEGYWIVDDPLTNPQPTYVPASQITFIKLNTPRSAKRGRPLFDGGCEILLRGAMELLRATMATVTSRAKIALIRKFNNVVKDAAAKMVTELTTQTVTDPNNGQQQNMSKMGYGTILNSSGQIEYEMPAQNFETNIHYQALQMVLRAVCARAQFPEFMLTADPSSGTFSNSFIAEAPSTKQFGSLQKMLAQHVGSNRRRRHRSMAWVQVVHAVECGLLHPDVLHTVQIETKGPGLVVRDKAGEAATNKTYVEMRIKPPQMVQQELGIDPQVAEKMWEEWDKKQEDRMKRQAELQAKLQPPTPPGDTGEDGGNADGDGEDGDRGQPREPDDKPKPKPSGLQESHQEADDDTDDKDRLQRFVWSADDLQFDDGEGLAEGLMEEVDAAGNEHKGKGAGGGQFTGHGGDGAGAKSESGKKPCREIPNPVRQAVHQKAEDADLWAKGVIHQTEPLTPPEADAIAAYRKTKAVYEINNYLRATQAEVLAQRDSQDTAGYIAAAANKAKHKLLGVGKANKQVVKNLDAAIAKSKTTEDMTVMRGMKLPKGSDMLQSLKPGRVITDHGFVSTTMASEVAERFSLTSMADHEGVTFAIHVPKGSNAYHMPRSIGEYNEAELVLPRGARFSIHSVEKIGGKTHVQLKYIGPSPSRPVFEGLQFDSGKSIDTEDLAHLYAELWQGRHPKDIGEQDLATADAELSAGQHVLSWDEYRGWHVVSPAATLEAALLEEVHRAPKGGVSINGKKFRGGMFIPAADYKNASMAEKAAIDNPTKAAADKRKSRGPVDEQKLRAKLQPHSTYELTPQEMISAKRSLAALRHHHGKLTLHRLEELADQLQAAHDRTPEDEEGKRTQFSRRLKSIEHQIDLYKAGPDQKKLSLHEIVKKSGGISIASLEAHGFDVPILKENGLGGLFRKNGGRDITELASELHNEGHIVIPGVDYHGTEGNLSALKQKTFPTEAPQYLLDQLEKNVKSLQADADAEYEAAYNAYTKEKRDAEADESEIAEAIRSGQEDADREAEKGDAWEPPGALASLQNAGDVEPDPWDLPDPKPISPADIKEAKRKLANQSLAVKGNADSDVFPSDLSGHPIRRHVELAGGGRIHPDELHRAAVNDQGQVELHPHESIDLKDPLNKGPTKAKSFEQALREITAYKGHDEDRVTLQSPHGYTSTMTRGEWRQQAKDVSDKSFASWYDRVNPPAQTDAAKAADRTLKTKLGGEQETADFFKPPAEQGKLYDSKTPPVGANPHEPPTATAGSTVLPGGKKISFIPHPNQRREETTIMIDPKKLDASWSKHGNEYLPPDSKGESEVEGRRDAFNRFLESGKPVQASRVFLRPDGEISFADGRHRLAVLRDAGAPQVAITVPKKQAKEIASRFAASPES